MADFGSEKQFKVKKAYFMKTEIEWMNERKVKFLQIKQDTIR